MIDDLIRAMLALEKYVHGGTLGEDLISIVKIRVSQLNGCAYCLDRHCREARKRLTDTSRVGYQSS